MTSVRHSPQRKKKENKNKINVKRLLLTNFNKFIICIASKITIGEERNDSVNRRHVQYSDANNISTLVGQLIYFYRKRKSKPEGKTKNNRRSIIIKKEEQCAHTFDVVPSALYSS